MNEWTDAQAVAIAKRVLSDERSSDARRLWAASVLSAASYVMDEPLTDEQRRLVFAALRNSQHNTPPAANNAF